MTKGPWRTLSSHDEDGEEITYDTEAECREAAEKFARETDDWVGIQCFEDGQWWLVDSVGKPVHRDFTAKRVGLGDYVKTHHYGYLGRVYKVHPYGCPEDDAWLKGQTIPVDQYKREPWVSVLVHDGGAIVAPSALVDLVEPFELANDSEKYYFRAHDPE